MYADKCCRHTTTDTLKEGGGSPLIVAVLDNSQAFDLAQSDKLFKRLMARLPAIVVRFLLYSYKNRYVWAWWGTSQSGQFLVRNGTRQGSIVSPDAWSSYTDPLLKRLRTVGIGCRLADLFMGAFLYTDDQLLIATNRRTMELMLLEVEQFVCESNIHFSLMRIQPSLKAS